MPRYVDEPTYGRPREALRNNDTHTRRGVDPRDPRDPRDLRDMRDSRDPRDPRDLRDSRDIRDQRDTRIVSDRDYRMEDPMDVRMDTRMDPRMDPRSDPRMDPRMDARPEPRANVGTRVAARQPEVMYRDTQTGQIYQDVPSRRTPYEDDFQDPSPNPRNRPVTATTPASAPTQTKPSYNEYFVLEDGIDREVIQRDICMWLGPDALCRRGEDKEGRKGYIIKAYRALTSAMITSLQEASTKYWAEKANRRRQGRSELSYSEISDIQNSSPYDDPMDEDDRPSYPPAPRMGREIDPRDPRAQVGPRHGLPPTSSYMTDPGYPAQYSIGSAQAAQHGMQYEPRYAGNTTPPSTMRTSHPGFPSAGFPPSGFPPSGYPARTTQSSIPPSMTAPSYRDPGTDRMAPYPPDPRYRR